MKNYKDLTDKEKKKALSKITKEVNKEQREVMSKNNTLTDWKKGQEKRFIKWAEARDDDWWQDGCGMFSIWDFRIMQDFFSEELLSQKDQIKKEIEKEKEISRQEGFKQGLGSASDEYIEKRKSHNNFKE